MRHREGNIKRIKTKVLILVILVIILLIKRFIFNKNGAVKFDMYPVFWTY